MKHAHSLASDLYASADSDVDKRLMHIMYEQDQKPEVTDNLLPKFTLLVGPSPFTMPRGWEFFLCSPYEGATYISTVLCNAGYPVRIVDVRYTINPLDEAFKQIIEGTDVLGITTFEDNFPFVLEIIDKIKSYQKDLPVICGGSLVTSVPHIFMKYTKTDIAVISEGELTILELMESYSKDEWKDSLQKIRGIWYRDKDGLINKTKPRGQMLSLDYLPRMRLDLWPQTNSSMGLQPQIIASYSRGCKMDCSFCYRTTPQVSLKSPEKFNNDLNWLKEKYNIQFILFSDLTFSSEKNKTLEMCEVIKDYDFRWACLTRCADVDKERLNSMRDSGCDIALFGVESLGAKALKEARKPTNEDISNRAMHLTFEAGIRFGALLIIGLPGETKQGLDYMATWAEKYNHVTRVKYLSSMPGTTVYRQCIDNGLLKSELDHLNWLSIEQALYRDEFVNITKIPEIFIRQTYKRIYDSYQPGPVMDFKHYPEYFDYFYPNSDDGKNSSTDYAGKKWRSIFSSAGPHLIPGSERFTLDKVGAKGSSENGAKIVECGAKLLEKQQKTEK